MFLVNLIEVESTINILPKQFDCMGFRSQDVLVTAWLEVMISTQIRSQISSAVAVAPSLKSSTSPNSPESRGSASSSISPSSNAESSAGAESGSGCGSRPLNKSHLLLLMPLIVRLAASHHAQLRSAAIEYMR